MNREERDLIVLGAASVETRGGPIGMEDEEGTRWYAAGLTDD